MKTISILGANGRASTAIARAFVNDGWHVIAVSRSGVADNMPSNVEHRAADAMDQGQLIKACEGSDIVFNGLNPPYPDWSKYCLPMAQNTIAAAKATSATHLFIGNVYNYGYAIDLNTTETTRTAPETKKGKIRVEMESLFRRASKEGVQTLTIRAGDFFGGSTKGSWFDLSITSKLSKGTFTYPGPTDKPHAWAYLPDLAQAFVRIANKANSLPAYDVYNFTGYTLTGAQMKNLCETSLNRRFKQAGIPWTIIKLGGLVVPMWREISEMAYLWSTAHSLDGSKLDALIGHDYVTPAPRAIDAALQALNFEQNRQSEKAA